MNIRGDSLCSLCGELEETIDHLFWECGITSQFILDVEQCFIGHQFVFLKQNVFFGYELIPHHPYNLLLFHLKYYIFNKKRNFELPMLNEFIYKFKFVLQVEKQVQYSNVTCPIPYERFIKAFSTNPRLFT